MGDPSGSRQFVASYCKVEKCIIGKGGGDDGSSTDALIYAYWGQRRSTRPGQRCPQLLHARPADGKGGARTSTSTRRSVGPEMRGGNVFSGSAPGYTNAGSANFLLVGGANALGYGPNRIQP